MNEEKTPNKSFQRIFCAGKNFRPKIPLNSGVMPKNKGIKV